MVSPHYELDCFDSVLITQQLEPRLKKKANADIQSFVDDSKEFSSPKPRILRNAEFQKNLLKDQN